MFWRSGFVGIAGSSYPLWRGKLRMF